MMKHKEILLLLISMAIFMVSTVAFAIQSNIIEIRYVAAPPDPAKYAIIPAGPLSLTSGQTQVFGDSAKDAYNNDVSAGTTYPWGSRSRTFSVIAGTGNGTFAGNVLTVTTAGTLTVKSTSVVTANGTTYTMTAYCQVQVNPGPVDPDTSTVTGPSNGIANGTVYTIILTARDAGNNLKPGVAASISSSRAQDVIETLQGTTDANGQAIFTIATTLAGTATISGIADGVSIAQTLAIDFAAGPATHFAVTNIPLSTTAGKTYAIAVEALDAHGNRATYTDTVNLTDLSGSITPTTVNVVNGLGYAGITMTTAHTANVITASKNGLSGSSIDFRVDPDVPYSISVVTSSTEISVDTTATITVTSITDRFGNSIVPETTYDSFTSGSILFELEEGVVGSINKINAYQAEIVPTQTAGEIGRFKVSMTP